MIDYQDIITDDVLQAMGISAETLQEVVSVVGRMPTVDELSTLLAMWDSNGRQQSFRQWLRFQPHSAEHHDYLYSGTTDSHLAVREPRVRECIDIAHTLRCPPSPSPVSTLSHGHLLYMVGRVSSEILGSAYARQCLHLAEVPATANDDEEMKQYMLMILHAMRDGGLIEGYVPIGEGGIFGTLAGYCGAAGCGFDILTCREVRLDAFLFGEEPGRLIASLTEEQDDTFLLKLDEAGLDCCFLGRTTRGRIVIDGMDFGNTTDYLTQ